MNKEVLHKAIDLLSRREHSVNELKNKLLMRDFEPNDIELVIAFVLEKNYLSNERFTDVMIRSRASKGYGKRYIENELQQKGIDQSLINLLMNEQEIDWYQQAEQAYKKRFGDTEIKDQKDKAKRIRFLQYRGFSTDEILTVLSNVSKD